VQSVPITTKVVSVNPVHGEVYSIQHYVIKFVSDLRQIGGFLRALQFPPPIKLTATGAKFRDYFPNYWIFFLAVFKFSDPEF
jgi:hypothetical protein